MRKALDTFLILLLCTNALGGFSQLSLSYTVNNYDEQCEKGIASVTIEGLTKIDSVSIRWSTGQTNTVQIFAVPAGDHSVNVFVKRKSGNLVFVKDTTLYYTVKKTDCPVIIPKYFSPNDDQYNDDFRVGNLQYYPNFELEIFNRWGQRVHFQKNTFSPWDGKWLGANLPDGTYYVIVFPDPSNRSKVVKGDVTILR